MPDQSISTGWRRQMPNLLAEMFKPGTEVRHLNPEYADWTGVVVTEVIEHDDGTSEDTRRYISVNDYSVFDEGLSTTVYIEWNGNPDRRSWTNVDAIDVIDEPAAVTA